MDILGVGPLEIILVIILALVVLGPQDMVVSARKIGAWIRKMVRSPLWREIMETSREIREIPTTLIRDSGIQEAMTELKDAGTIVKNELGEATHELSSEVQQANQDLNTEAATAASEAQQASQEPGAELVTAAAEAQPGPTGMPPLSPEIPSVQPWPEEAGNQPAPILPADYPQTIPLGVEEAPENIILPSQSAAEPAPAGAEETEQGDQPASAGLQPLESAVQPENKP